MGSLLHPDALISAREDGILMEDAPKKTRRRKPAATAGTEKAKAGKLPGAPDLKEIQAQLLAELSPEDLEPGVEEKREIPKVDVVFRKLIEFGEAYHIQGEADFREAAHNYAEEAVLIARMRSQIDQEGLTVMKTYKTGDMPVAHPLLQEIPRHVDCANKTLATISDIMMKRGAKREETGEDLDAFRL
jgi:hypothetical protein